MENKSNNLFVPIGLEKPKWAKEYLMKWGFESQKIEDIECDVIQPLMLEKPEDKVSDTTLDK